MSSDEKCACPCGVCADGYHIFCNRFPHGDPAEAVKWFSEHPEALETCVPLSDSGQAVMDEARAVVAARKG